MIEEVFSERIHVSKRDMYFFVWHFYSDGCRVSILYVKI